MNERIAGVCLWVTTKCNLSCPFCYAELNTVEDQSIAVYKEILNKIASLGIKKVTFSGGEPLLLKFLVELLRHAKLLGLKTAIISNGILLSDKKINELKPFLDEITLPIESISCKVSDEHRTKNHNHENVMMLITNNKKYQKINFDVSTVVTKINKDYLDSIFYFLLQNDIKKWKLFQYSPLNNSHSSIFYISDDDFLEIEKKINSILDESISVDFRYRKNVSSYINILPDGFILISDNNSYTKIDNILSFNNIDNFINKLKECNFPFSEHLKRHFRDV